MKIWLNDIKGQIDIINGLNHYIGMRKISVAMFPEFAFLGYVVGFYILLGLAVAIIGSGADVQVELHDGRKEFATDVLKVAAVGS